MSRVVVTNVGDQAAAVEQPDEAPGDVDLPGSVCAVGASAGWAWWLLCHEPPTDSGARAATLRLLSRVRCGRLPRVWPIELTPQVTWSSRKIRARPPHSRPPTAPRQPP